MSTKKRLPPTHPGDLLKEELEERGISLNKLARDTRIALSRISLIANGKRAVTFLRLFSVAPRIVSQPSDEELLARGATRWRGMAILDRPER